MGLSDRQTILLQGVNPECRQHVVLHGKGSSWDELVQSIRFFEEQTRLCESGSLNAVGDNGLCWNCGRAGHYSSQCPLKGKGKDDKGKGKGGRGHPSAPKGARDDKGKGKGKKGDKGKDKGKNPKGKAKAKPKAKGRAVEDEPGEQVMALGFHLRTARDPGTRSTEPNSEPEPPRLTMTNSEIERLNQSSVMNSNFTWLIDSGATCHVLSDDALGFYEVVKEHSGPLPVLMSASETPMECTKLVDVRVKFGKLAPIVLQRVLVCKIGFNVISSWQAAASGWNTWLTSVPEESCLIKYTERGSSIWVPLVREARSWWAIAKELDGPRPKAKAKAKKNAPPKPGWEPLDDAMEVDCVKKAPRNSPNIGRSLEVTPFKFLLRSIRSTEVPVLTAEKRGESVFSEKFSVGPEAVCACEDCFSSAAVLLKRASTTSNGQQNTRSECAVGVGVGKCSAFVGVGPVPPKPQSFCTTAGRSEGACVGVRKRSSARVGRLSLRMLFLMLLWAAVGCSSVFAFEQDGLSGLSEQAPKGRARECASGPSNVSTCFVGCDSGSAGCIARGSARCFARRRTRWLVRGSARGSARGIARGSARCHAKCSFRRGCRDRCHSRCSFRRGCRDRCHSRCSFRRGCNARWNSRCSFRRGCKSRANGWRFRRVRGRFWSSCDRGSSGDRLSKRPHASSPVLASGGET